MLDYSGSKDVIVNEEEWDSILQAIRTKDSDLKEMLTKYRTLLGELGDSGFTKGPGHENIVSMSSAIQTLDEALEPLLGKTETLIQTYISEIQEEDHYKEVSFKLHNTGGGA